MNNLAIIGLSVLLCFIMFGIVAGNYITPRLQAWSREDAIKALVAPRGARFSHAQRRVANLVLGFCHSGSKPPDTSRDDCINGER